MKAHIQARERLHAVALYLVVLAPELVGTDQLAKLRAPVAQVVDSHGLVSEIIINAAQALADHRRA